MNTLELIDKIIAYADSQSILVVTPLDTGKNEYHIVGEQYKADFILIYIKELREEITFLSNITRRYDTDCKHGYRYSGFIHRTSKIWYDPPATIPCNTNTEFDMGFFRSAYQLEEEITAKYKDLLVGKFMTSDINSKKVHDIEDITSRLYDMILSGCDIQNYNLRAGIDKWNIDFKPDIIAYLALQDAYLDEMVEATLPEWFGRLQTEYNDINKIKAEHKRLKKNPTHPIWFKAEMLFSLPEEGKYVQATFQVDSCTITDRIKIEVLKKQSELQISGTYIPQKVNDVMDALMGRSKRGTRSIKYNSILQLRYKGKIIYDKVAFMQQGSRYSTLRTSCKKEDRKEGAYEM